MGRASVLMMLTFACAAASVAASSHRMSDVSVCGPPLRRLREFPLPEVDGSVCSAARLNTLIWCRRIVWPGKRHSESDANDYCSEADIERETGAISCELLLRTLGARNLGGCGGRRRGPGASRRGAVVERDRRDLDDRASVGSAGSAACSRWRVASHGRMKLQATLSW